MVRTSLFKAFLCLLILVFASLAQASTFSAHINRDVIEEGETFELELKIDESSILSQPDLSVLEKDFDLVDQSRNSRLQIINGQSQSSTVWKLTLSPKSSGTLTIPAISLDDLSTQPVTLTVHKASDSSVRHLQTNADIRVEAALDKNQVFVQEQTILSVRLLYRGVQISQWALSEPDFEGAVVHELGSSTQYEKQVGNVSYGVLERRYAVFPQKSGQLNLKPVIFQGIVHQGGGRYFLGQGKKIQEKSPALSLKVNPQAPEFSYSVWLPAQALSLEERWSAPLDQLKVGDSLTRSITLKAVGQSSTILPPVELHVPDGIKAYPDKANLDESVAKEGLIGQRVENIAIIPGQAGQFVLPALEVPWWDTVNQKVQIARLPAHTLSVQAEKNSTLMSDHVKPAIESVPSLQPRPIPALANPALEAELAKWKSLTLVLAGLLGLLVLGLLMYLLQQRRRTPKQLYQVGAQKNNAEKQLARAYEQLLIACESDNLKAIQAALLEWGACYCGQTIHSLGELARCLDNAAITTELQALEKHLYGSSDIKVNWQARSLLALMKALPPFAAEKKASAGDTLKKLYPDM